MKITVLGAIGKTGLLVVEQALARGYEVVAYVRNSRRLPQHTALTIVQSELNNISALAEAMSGSQAVLCCLGTHQLKKVTLMQTQLPHIVQAMQQAQVGRLVLLSAYGVGDSFQMAGCIAKLAYKTMVKDVYTDKALAEQKLVESDLTWTSVYPVILTDGALSDAVETALLPKISKVKGLPKVSRANVAKTMLDVISDQRTFRQQVVLSSANSMVRK